MNTKLRYMFCGLLFAAAVLLTVRLFHPDDPLANLKEAQVVTEGTSEAEETARKAVEAVAAKNNRALYALMLEPDGPTFQRMNATLGDEPFAPAQVLGCTRLKQTARPEDITVYVRSAPRGKVYQFCMRKDAGGAYRLLTVSRALEIPKELKR